MPIGEKLSKDISEKLYMPSDQTGWTVNTKIPELKKYDIIKEYGVREYEETFQFIPLMED